MSLAAVALNALLLVAGVFFTVHIVPSMGMRDAVAGIAAAGIALSVLIGLQYLANMAFIPLATHFPASSATLNLAVVALVEEIAKYTVVAPWQLENPSDRITRSATSSHGGFSSRRIRRRERSARAAGRGVGFAAAEHLLFLLIPTGLFLRRLLMATTLHTATALLYARPAFLRRRGLTGTTPLTDTALVLLGTAIHLAYNLVLQGLDGLTVF